MLRLPSLSFRIIPALSDSVTSEFVKLTEWGYGTNLLDTHKLLLEATNV